MSEYFLWATKTAVSKAKEGRIDKAVRAIDPTMSFVTHNHPGTALRGWLVRPNDGTNDYAYRRATNEACVRVAQGFFAKA